MKKQDRTFDPVSLFACFCHDSAQNPFLPIGKFLRIKETSPDILSEEQQAYSTTQFF